MENENPKEDAQEKMTPRGKDKFLEMMRAKNPDYNPENDDQLFDDAHEMYSNADSELGKHKEANSKLAGLVGKDPKLGAVLGMVAGDDQKSFPYAVGKIYGKQPFELDDDGLEEFEKGYQENLAQMEASKSAQEEAQKNIQEYWKNLDKYAKDNNLSDEEKSELNDKIYSMADNMLMGIIPIDVIELVNKGVNYDKDVQDAADSGVVEGKNQKVEAKLSSKKEQIMPDLKNTSSSSKKVAPTGAGGNFFSGFKG